MSDSQNIPLGYCQCGCGQKTKIVARTVTRLGIKAGQPRKWILGHRHGTAEGDFREDAEAHCWIWQRAKTNGYGIFGNGLAHRVFYEHANGPIPDGLVLDHLCGNKACVNPGHLEAVAPAENTRRGGHVKLGWHAVTEIRLSSESTRRIADRYGVTKMAVNSVRASRAWPESDRPPGVGAPCSERNRPWT